MMSLLSTNPTYGKPPIPILKRDKSWKEFIKNDASETSHLTNKFSDNVGCDGVYWKPNNPNFQNLCDGCHYVCANIYLYLLFWLCLLAIELKTIVY
jgi:hypothetical protein